MFEKSPTLRFVAIEGRLTLLPSLLWRMDDNFKGLHAETPWLKPLPSDWIREHSFLTTLPIETTDAPGSFCK